MPHPLTFADIDTDNNLQNRKKMARLFSSRIHCCNGLLLYVAPAGCIRRPRPADL